MVTCHTNVNLLKPHRHQGLGKQNKTKQNKNNSTQPNIICSELQNKLHFSLGFLVQ